MNKDLEDYISKCETCNTYLSSQQKETLICHVPHRPWEKVGCDIFTLNEADYLCTVDYYSDYFEVDLLHKKTGKTVMKKLEGHFGTHGIPDKLQSDNGPPYNSHEFSEFTKKCEFEHKTSYPEYPQSNGKVESAVNLAKTLLKKAAGTRADFQLSLLDWRNTPTEGMGSSPAQRILEDEPERCYPLPVSF